LRVPLSKGTADERVEELIAKGTTSRGSSVIKQQACGRKITISGGVDASLNNLVLENSDMII
jgi:hypothetical protein